MKRVLRLGMACLAPILTVGTDPAEAGRGVASFYSIAWQDPNAPEAILNDSMFVALQERGFTADEFKFFWEGNLTDNPMVTVAKVFDYTTSPLFRTFNLGSHANPAMWTPEYFVTEGARTAKVDYYLYHPDGPRYDPSWIRIGNGHPAPRIAIHADGFAGKISPSIDERALVHLAGCNTWPLGTSMLENLGPGGQTFVGYDRSIYFSTFWSNLVTWTQGMTCQLWPGLNNGAEEVTAKMSFAKLDGDPEGRILPGVDCHNWAGTVVWQGVTLDQRIVFAILNDWDSHYKVQGFTSFGRLEEPDVVARFAGMAGSGQGKVRVYSIPAADLNGYVAFEIVEKDRLGRESIFPMFPSTLDETPASWTTYVASDGERDIDSVVEPFEVNEVGMWQLVDGELVPRNVTGGAVPAFSERAPVAGGCPDCADIVVLGHDVQILDEVAAQAESGQTESGEPVKVLAFLALPDVRVYRDILKIVHQENIAEGSGRYPVSPGPILKLAGDAGITDVDTYEDNPEAPACQQPLCRGVTSIGDIYQDGSLVCPISVVPAETRAEAQVAMLFGNEWNAKSFVRSDNRLLAVSGNRAAGSEYPELGRTLREDVMVWWQSDTLAVREEMAYGPLDISQMRVAGCQAINQGIKYLWAMGLYTGVNNLSYFISGSTFPQVPLTTRQRIGVFAPTCWSGATWWEPFEGPSIVRKLMCLANPNGTGAAFFVGHHNGAYGFMHEWAAKILARHFALAPEGRVAELVFFEAVQEIHEIDPIYARGLVFYGGYVYWHGLDTAADLPELQVSMSPSIQLRTIPQAGGTIEFRFTIPDRNDVRLEVVDVRGRRVETVDVGQVAAGEHSYQWAPKRVASGVYFGSLSVGGATASDKFVLRR